MADPYAHIHPAVRAAHATADLGVMAPRQTDSEQFDRLAAAAGGGNEPPPVPPMEDR